MKFNIWKDYPRKPLPELLSFIVDNRGKSVPTSEDGTHILIATNCIRNENLYPTYEKVRYFSDDVYNTWFRAHPIPGDIIFVNKGTPGRTCLVPDPIDFSIAQDMMAFRTNEEVLHNRYLLCVLRSHEIQEQIRLCSVGDTIPHFKKQFLDQLMIPIPPREVQKCIADMYFSFSDKIALNQQINKNLEEQAQAIYKDMLCENDCKAVELQELCTFQEGYVNPPQGNTEYFDGEVKWLRAVDINESYIINTSRTLTKEGFDSAKKSALLFEPDTIAISKSGTIGRLGIIGDYMCGNRAVINIKPKQKEMLPFIYLYLKSRQREFEELAVGSVQKNLYVSLLEPLIVMIPKKDVLQSFCENADRQFEMIKGNCLENERLSQIRDALLPRLMSGEIDVSGIEI